MKLQHKTRHAIVASIMLFMFLGCYQPQDRVLLHEAALDVSHNTIDAETAEIAVSDPVAQADLDSFHVGTNPTIVESPTTTHVSHAIPVAAINHPDTVARNMDPREYAKSVFADDIAVDPWRANYVGSYGVLPTRVQDKGPFLYSYDISPDANIFEDDDLAPGPHHFWRDIDDDY